MKNMRNILLFCLCFVLLLREVCGASQNEIKRGSYPYMAVVYYPDITIVGPAGDRFTRSAVLVRIDWLISSSLETNDTRLAFPQKTLVARAGAIVLDSNYTYNEEEGEQEQEIVQIVRPTNFTTSQWWDNDISLLKTLLPFIMTTTVASTTLSVKSNFVDKSCYILVFAKKYRNSTDDKVLMQLSVELLPTSNENCGTQFRNETMICASNSDENKNIEYDPDFCYTNGGGPLICQNDVIGLQTYIGNNCKQPYLYQSLSAWDDFITCGVEDKCRIQQCANICVNIEKDEVIPFETNEIKKTLASETAKDIIDQSSEDSNDEEPLILPDTTLVNLTINNENDTPSHTTTSMVEITTTKETTPQASPENEEKTTDITEKIVTSWPKEKPVGHRKKLDNAESSENIERTSNVEPQRRILKKKKSAANAAKCYVMGKMGLTFQLLFLICII